MLSPKKIIKIFFTILFVFITMHVNAKPKSHAQKKYTEQAQDTEKPQDRCSPTKKNVLKHWKHKRMHDPYNGTVWGGVGFVFATTLLGAYIELPTVDYQIGVSKSLYNRTPDSFLYWALIFDYAHSNERLGLSAAGVRYHAKYNFTNEQFLLGYEQAVGVPYVSFFAEAGGVFQQREFSIAQKPSNFIAGGFFGGSFNLGFNFRIVPRNHMNYLFRLGVNAMVGESEYTMVHYNKQRININSVPITPSLSFGIRI